MNILRNTYRILAVALVVAAVSTPVAAAAPFEERFPSVSGSDEPYSSVNSIAPPGQTPADVGTGPSAAVSEPQAGFDWGDATVGAAAMLAITAIAAGGAVELSRRRRPRPTVA